MATDNRSIPDLLSDALRQFSALVRSEINLARAELSLKASQATAGIALLLGGALILMPALVLVLMALAAWLMELGMRPPLAYLLAGLIGLLISAALGWVGKNRLNPEELTPKRTMDQLQRDVAATRDI